MMLRMNKLIHKEITTEREIKPQREMTPEQKAKWENLVKEIIDRKQKDSE